MEILQEISQKYGNFTDLYRFSHFTRFRNQPLEAPKSSGNEFYYFNFLKSFVDSRTSKDFHKPLPKVLNRLIMKTKRLRNILKAIIALNFTLPGKLPKNDRLEFRLTFSDCLFEQI